MSCPRSAVPGWRTSRPSLFSSISIILATTIGTRTANATRTVLKMMFAQAEKWEMIARNPMTGTEKKAHSTKPAILWEVEEVKLFLAAAMRHRLYALFYLTFMTGLRIGEVLALRWADVKGDTIVVSRSVDTRTGRVVESAPKSAAGRRIIALDVGTMAVLAEHRERQRAELVVLGMQPDQEPERMFTSHGGTTINASNLYKVFQALMQEAGVPHARFHDLRHMHLSRLIFKGVDVRTVADRAGHADPVLTMRQYVHAFDAQRKRAALPLEDLLDEE
jgi:integrase